MSLKIPLRVHPFFWLLAALIGFLNSSEPIQIVVWVFIIFISVLVHECGHAFTGKLFGQNVRIELMAFGGMTYREGRKLKAWEEFCVVLMGPVAGFMLCLLSFFLQRAIENKESLFFFAAHITTLINFLWTLLNLIPILPLDGGQLLRIILEKFIGFKAMKVTHLISLVLSLALTFLFFVEAQIFLGILFFMLSFMSYRSFKESSFMSVRDQDMCLQKLFEGAEKKLLEERKEEALEDFLKIRSLSNKGIIYNVSTETAALILLEKRSDQGESKKRAYELFSSLPTISAEIIPRFHRLSFDYGNLEKTIELSEEAFQLNPTADTALITAKAYALKSQAKPAIGWLECAISEGIDDINALLQKSEFDPIKEDPEFIKFKDSNHGLL